MIRSRTATVLVIGTGAAGLRAAIAAHDAGGEVVVVGRRPRLDAHSVLASGGINAAIGTRDPEDSWQQHAADTLREGYWLGDPRIVETVCMEAPAAIAELDEWDCPFARSYSAHSTTTTRSRRRYSTYGCGSCGKPREASFGCSRAIRMRGGLPAPARRQ